MNITDEAYNAITPPEPFCAIMNVVGDYELLNKSHYVMCLPCSGYGTVLRPAS